MGMNKYADGHLVNNQFQLIGAQAIITAYVKPIRDPIEGVTRWT